MTESEKKALSHAEVSRKGGKKSADNRRKDREDAEKWRKMQGEQVLCGTRIGQLGSTP